MNWCTIKFVMVIMFHKARCPGFFLGVGMSVVPVPVDLMYRIRTPMGQKKVLFSEVSSFQSLKCMQEW